MQLIKHRSWLTQAPSIFLVTLILSLTTPNYLWAQFEPAGKYECAAALSMNPEVTATTEDGEPLSTSQEEQEALFMERAESFGQNISITGEDIDATITEEIENFEAYRTGYKKILELFLNPQEVFRYMAKIETEFRRHQLQNEELTDIEVLEAVLSFYEQREDVGFGESLTLENRGYSATEWYEMLREGRPFLDTAFDQGQNESREGHGYYTHRMQWMVVIFDYLEKGAESYGNLTPVELFVGLGTFTDTTSSGRDLWFSLFDSFDGNLKQPETFRPLHGFWPYMMGWY